MKIKINKKDVIWGYAAQFFSIASGIIVLPFILGMLSSEEIGLNYLMITIGALVALFDFGFAPQFGRNITYVFSGVDELKKEGVETVSESKEINYRLLATMIHTARFVYRRLALIVLAVMLTFGSLYIYNVTDGFSHVKNSLVIWIIFSISTFFNVYYSYYTSLLTGKGLIMESKKATVYSKMTYIVLSVLFLFAGFGLMGVVLSNLIAPFVNRFISYRYFFTKQLKDCLNKFEITKNEKINLFGVIWHNAKKLGLVFVGAYAITKFSMFLAGLYLSLSDVASYGLMVQLFSVIMSISSTLFTIYQPKFSSLRVNGNRDGLIKDFAFTMNVYYLLFICGTVFLFCFVPWGLNQVQSNTTLPATGILLLYSVITLLEGNHSNFATLIVTKNTIPFVKPALIAGGAIALGSFMSLRYTSLGILGLVLVQGICQLAYANWKWPHVIFAEFKITFFSFILLGFKESKNILRASYGK
jgi:O-antigen/teichoic acid export membrane protein